MIGHRSYVLYAVRRAWEEDLARDQESRLEKVALDPSSAAAIAWAAVSLNRNSRGVEDPSFFFRQCSTGSFPNVDPLPLWLVDGCLVQKIQIEQLRATLPPLTQGLLHSLNWLDPQCQIEILYALAKMKVSRITLRVGDAARLQQVLGVPLACGPYAVWPRSDAALQGFSNIAGKTAFDRERNRLNLGASIDVYLSADWRDTVICSVLDQENQGGQLLGIPRCCRDWFLESWEECLRDSGGDLAFYSLKHLIGVRSLGIPALINPFAIYFGASLLSHFPCSLTCEESRTLAGARGEMLSQVAPDLMKFVSSCHLKEFWLSDQREIRAVTPSGSESGFCHVVPAYR